MSTKRRKSRFGPEVFFIYKKDRKAKMVFFIDDFNMPLKEEYSA